ncbi:MAG: type II toxin-antitoxin system VapB family antitoxin [Actinomycetota bacterium]
MRRRTNIELEMDLVEQIRRRFGLRTITEAVHLALERLAGPLPMTTEELLAMRGSMPDFDVPEDDNPIEPIWP